ncbi:unnamed protein product [Chrysodeixis includens]|uniref:non-specific serine/threonine protein kinase n=1 Tax=Chrysodeixis includens TaxID=689277 RepID=A0A9P0BH93_CHRIL|nr:unnamed protein product [Chrysodeixis includens]
MAAGAEFVEGWLVAQVLGEGAYGEVRLLVHARSGAAVALKVVRGAQEGEASEPAREAALHRALRHRHVLRCLGERTHQGLHYMFLEYAPGGELFDRIEPDVGMREDDARRYWRQLLSGLQYLHGRGVAHRDIKPENLLLDDHDELKISDFGMATLFRHGSRERLLSRVCGTVPYAAPEVLAAAQRPYRAAPADLWAAGLVLLAMLAGELPWERADAADARYAGWLAAGVAARGPWRRLGAGARGMLARLLRADAARRPGAEALLAGGWLRGEREGETRAWRSQPAGGENDAADGEGAAELSAADMDALICYSQPAQADDLPPTEPGALPLGRRRTRLWLRGDAPTALSALAPALARRGLGWRRLGASVLRVECAELALRVWAVQAAPTPDGSEARTLLEFRRSRGCGLQFMRRYAELRDDLRPLLVDPPPGTSRPVP